MKKFISLAFAFMFIFSLASAETEFSQNSFNLPLDEKLEIDLDNDYEAEKVLLRMEGVEDEAHLRLIIEGTDLAINIFDTGIFYPTACLFTDMDGDSVQEILLSGDMGSDDYATWCLNYDLETGIHPVLFKDANRGSNVEDYFEYGYGRIVAIDANTITLRGSQDVLGTWMADRTFTLKESRFELEDGGVWIMKDITGDEFIWEYYCLTCIREVPVTFPDGTKGVLAKGEKFIVTESDKLSFANFITQDGKTGRIDLTENTEEGWGHMINGIADYEYFEYIPYAD